MKTILILILTSLSLQAKTLNEISSEKSPFQLPDLGFKKSALAPAIGEDTMTLHHGKHHKAYVDNLNAALPKDATKNTLKEILGSTKQYELVVRNNAGGHWNHAFFWTLLNPKSSTEKISKELLTQIQKNFGSLDKFKEEFTKKSLGVFGSGWTWVIVDAKGSLQITTTQNQDNPLMDIANPSGKPILALDIWEHAYYLNYQNKRAEYIKSFWTIVNWDQVSDYYSQK